MTREQYLLVCLMEEAAEIQQLAAKALRFGLDNHHPDSTEPNYATLRKELIDFDAVRYMLAQEALFDTGVVHKSIDMMPKIEKLNKWMDISIAEGILAKEGAAE